MLPVIPAEQATRPDDKEQLFAVLKVEPVLVGIGR